MKAPLNSSTMLALARIVTFGATMACDGILALDGRQRRMKCITGLKDALHSLEDARVAKLIASDWPQFEQRLDKLASALEVAAPAAVDLTLLGVALAYQRRKPTTEKERQQAMAIALMIRRANQP